MTASQGMGKFSPGMSGWTLEGKMKNEKRIMENEKSVIKAFMLKAEDR
jgi:hypothetical protein